MTSVHASTLQDSQNIKQETNQRKVFDEEDPPCSLFSGSSSPSMHYINEFANVYTRSNRNDGVKGLNCFPSCRTTGHKINAFCGGTIVVQINETSDDVRTFCYCGHIRQYAALLHFQKGQRVLLKEVVLLISLAAF